MFLTFKKKQICYLTLCALMIASCSTVYFNRYIAIKEVYLIWICFINLTLSGFLVLIPTLVVKTFGQKNFTSIYGILLLVNV